MKILMIAMEYPPLMGGGGTYVQNLCHNLAIQGATVRLITNGEVDSTEKSNDKLTIVRSKNLLNLYNHNGDILKALDLLIAQIEEYKPEIVHTHHSLEKILFSMVNGHFRLPHIATHHKTPEYPGYIKKFNGKWAQYEFSNILRSEKYISSSQAFKNDLTSLGIDENSIEIVNPGVNDENYFFIEKTDSKLSKYRSLLGITRDDILVFIPTVIRPRKGVDFTLRAISETRIKEKKIKVILSGLSEFEQGSEKYTFYKNMVLPHQMLYLGKLTNEQMNHIYNLADVVMFGSQGEGLGLVLLEAMACHCPVVTTNVNGINEVIENGKNGLLCEYGDIESFSKNLKLVLTNQTIRNNIIAGGIRSLETTFNSRKQARRHLEIYSELICNREK